MWRNGTVEGLAACTRAFLVTRGGEGADEYAGASRRHHPVFAVDQVVDTNGGRWLLRAGRGGGGQGTRRPGQGARLWRIRDRPGSCMPLNRRGASGVGVAQQGGTLGCLAAACPHHACGRCASPCRRGRHLRHSLHVRGTACLHPPRLPRCSRISGHANACRRLSGTAQPLSPKHAPTPLPDTRPTLLRCRLAAAAGHSSPVSVAHWAGGLAVSQPQACKPACVTGALRASWRSMPPSPSRGWAPLQRLVLPPARLLSQLLRRGAGPSMGSPAAPAA